MTDAPFSHHRLAALALLNAFADLSHKESGFLGHVAVAETLSEKQEKWLALILQRRGLPLLNSEKGE